METKYYEFDREHTSNLLNSFNSQIINIENEKKATIQAHIYRNKIFSIDDVFKIQWPNESIPVETYRVKNIRWGITNDLDVKSDIIYDCIRVVKRNGRPSNRTTAISQTSILNSKNYEKHLDIL